MLPQNVTEYLAVSEIAVTRCFVDPKAASKLCEPPSTSEKDAIKGKWVRVDRNLNLEAGYMSGYLVSPAACIFNICDLLVHQNIYYRRTRRQDINLVTDIRLLPKDEQPSPLDSWHKASMSLHAGVMGAPPLFLWYHLGKTSMDMSSEERDNLITELDVLFGDDIPWYGFEKLDPPTLQSSRIQTTWLTYRRGVKSTHFIPHPRLYLP